MEEGRCEHAAQKTSSVKQVMSRGPGSWPPCGFREAEQLRKNTLAERDPICVPHLFTGCRVLCSSAHGDICVPPLTNSHLLHT